MDRRWRDGWRDLLRNDEWRAAIIELWINDGEMDGWVTGWRSGEEEDLLRDGNRSGKGERGMVGEWRIVSL